MTIFDRTGNAEYGATVSFNFDAESVWIGEDPANVKRPGVTVSRGVRSDFQFAAHVSYGNIFTNKSVCWSKFPNSLFRNVAFRIRAK